MVKSLISNQPTFFYKKLLKFIKNSFSEAYQLSSPVSEQKYPWFTHMRWDQDRETFQQNITNKNTTRQQRKKDFTLQPKKTNMQAQIEDSITGI